MAKNLWLHGDPHAGVRVVAVIAQSRLTDGVRKRAIEAAFGDVGNHAAQVLRSRRESSPEWAEAYLSYKPKETARLRSLAEVVEVLVPAAGEWAWEAQALDNHIGWALSARASVVAHEGGDAQAALQMVQHAQAFATSHDLRACLADDEAQYRASARRAGQGPQPERGPIAGGCPRGRSANDPRSAVTGNALSPVAWPPSIGTFLGTGLRLYGRDTYEPDPERYFATLYLVVFTARILPIGRYLVAEQAVQPPSTPGADPYQFHARAALTTKDRLHLAAALAVLLAFALWFASYLAEPAKTRPHQPATQQGTPLPNRQTPLSQGSTDMKRTGIQLDTGHDLAATAGGTPVGPNERRRARLIAERSRLRTRIADMRARIQGAEGTLSSRSEGIDLGKASFSVDRVLLDITDYRAVEAFNAKVRRHNEMVRTYERERHNHNRAVGQYNAELERLRVVESALSEMGE
ncbi:MAG: hypothetical protein FJX72_20800 [Armatimonadetes bacterium]|nr:hypothetical protein [Armatimonadota bacterium]